jgi:hypothetical protein
MLRRYSRGGATCPTFGRELTQVVSILSGASSRYCRASSRGAPHAQCVDGRGSGKRSARLGSHCRRRLLGILRGAAAVSARIGRAGFGLAPRFGKRGSYRVPDRGRPTCQCLRGVVLAYCCRSPLSRHPCCRSIGIGEARKSLRGCAFRGLGAGKARAIGRCPGKKKGEPMKLPLKGHRQPLGQERPDHDNHGQGDDAAKG